jgi:uncharacterized membrane protein
MVKVAVPAGWRNPSAPLVVMLALAFVMTAASYISKTPCVGPPYDEAGVSANVNNAYRLVCLTDIQVLWVGRGIDEGRFPYVDGRLDVSQGKPGQLLDGAIEYPVLTGVYMWFTGLPAGNSGQYLAWTAFFLLPVALLIGWQLASLVGWRGLVYAAAPALVFYSVYNWDLLAVAWVLGAVLAWRKGRYDWAAAFLGLGAATKIYPGFFLLPLLIERLVAGDRRGAAKVAGIGVGSWLAANVPFMLANVDGWWATYAFQAGRVPDLSTNSIYFWGFPEWSIGTVDAFSGTVIAVSWLAALVGGYLLRHRHGGYPWIGVSAAMLFSFLAWNKVYSPQYALWVLPFLALIAVRWGWWVVYWLIDAILFIGLFRWYHDANSALAYQAATFGGWSKTMFLAAAAVAVLFAPLAIRGRPGREPASPKRAGPGRDQASRSRGRSSGSGSGSGPADSTRAAKPRAQATSPRTSTP